MVCFFKAHHKWVKREQLDHFKRSEDRNHFISIYFCPGSYFYLVAIKALVALVITHTDDVLPSLIEFFHDKIRSIEERFNVGEVLMRLCKPIGKWINLTIISMTKNSNHRKLGELTAPTFLN